MLWKHDIGMSICPWIGVKLSTPLQYIATGPIMTSHRSKLQISTEMMRAKRSPAALRDHEPLYMPWSASGAGVNG